MDWIAERFAITARMESRRVVIIALFVGHHF
jgi:hypothetical protein